VTQLRNQMLEELQGRNESIVPQKPTSESSAKLFEQLFQEIVARCLEVGLVRRDNLSVDGDGHSFAYLGSTVWGVVPLPQPYCKQ
jgi:hypothetical protein